MSPTFVVRHSRWRTWLRANTPVRTGVTFADVVVTPLQYID